MTEELGCVCLGMRLCTAVLCHLVCYSMFQDPLLNDMLLETPVVMLTRAAHTNMERLPGLWQ